MEATVRVPEVKVIGTDGKPLTRESKELNAAVSGYLDKIFQMYKKDVAAVSDGEEGHEEITSDYRIVTDNERDCLVCVWIRLLPWVVRTVLQRYTILTRKPER